MIFQLSSDCLDSSLSKAGSMVADVHKLEHLENYKISRKLCEKGSKELNQQDQIEQNFSERRNATEKAKSLLPCKERAEKSICPFCRKEVSAVTRHVRESCRSNPKNLTQCPKCNMDVIKTHLQEHLEGRINRKTGKEKKHPCRGDEMEEGRTKKWKCGQCGILVKSMQRHMKHHEKRDLAAQESKVKNEDRKMHKFLIEEREREGATDFQCDQCQKYLGSRGALKDHMPLHLTEKPFQCESCGKEFNQKGNLKAHVKTYHSKISTIR